MKINIDKLLKKQKKSRYWLSKEINIAYSTMKKIADNNTESIKFEIIENLCIALNCTPTDLLEIEKKEELKTTTFTKRIKELRYSKNVTNDEIAKNLKCTVQHYKGIECGTTKISQDKLIKLATYFQVSTDYLLGLSDDQERR